MAGSLNDLSQPDLPLPTHFIIDSSIVIGWLASSSRTYAYGSPQTLADLRAIRLVARIESTGTTALVTATALNEVLHHVVKTGYRRALASHGGDLVARYPNVRRHNWQHLFEARSDLLKQLASELDDVRTLMEAANLVVLQPEDLGSIPSGRSLDEELVRTMARYELDSNDAAILVEARRAGVGAIASSDSDLRRAALDFDVYTWF